MHRASGAQQTLDLAALSTDQEWPLQIPAGCPIPPTWPPAPDWWDVVAVMFSGGIDSHAMLLWALETYPPERVIAVHNSTGDDHTEENRLVAFPGGTLGFVRAECEALGVPLTVTHGPADYLELAGRRGMWPDSRARYCTSDLKRSPTDKVLRNLMLELTEERGKWSSPSIRFCTDRTKQRPTDRVLRHLDAKKVLMLTGELRSESPARSRRQAYELRMGALAPTKGRLVVWHRPMLDWSKEDEVRFIWSRGREIAPTYAGGTDRLSCRHCFYLSFERQVLSVLSYPEAAAEFVRVEEQIGHRVNLSYKWTNERGSFVGYRAVWEAVWGPWGEPPGEPSPYAQAVAARLRGEAEEILTALREGRPATFRRHGRCAG